MTDAADRLPRSAYDKAAAKIEGLYVSRWPGRKLPVLTARIGSRHQVIARFRDDNAAELFLALIRRGVCSDD